MQVLINQIVSTTDLPVDKAGEALVIVSEFIKEKYPLLAVAVDTVLGLPTEESVI